jgi:hypothetical protein
VTCDKLVVSLGTPVSPTSKTDRHDLTEILLKVVLTTTTPNPLKLDCTRHINIIDFSFGLAVPWDVWLY